MNQVLENIQNLENILHKQKTAGDLRRPEFRHILDEIEVALDRQDSDVALSGLVHGAIELRASDIHLELHENDSQIRFRIDGALESVGVLSVHDHTAIVERMKYRSNLKLNIHDVPQDGKFRFGKDGHDSQIDVRVSVMPTRYGESIVCRILDSSQTVMTLDSLGIIGTQKSHTLSAIQKKQGMILVTGPTGSGKTTTLYTLIDALRNPEDKIITLEDPIEYQIPGILQSEINERQGYTFSLGIRSVLRHDPDVIMVGEIRDLDTARTAVQASLTGHLVLSTLHTKSALETLERLENMGVSPFDVAASLDLIISQRLVRRICHKCSEPHSYSFSDKDKDLLELYGSHESFPQKGKGCEQCGFTGYSGRIGIYEVFRITDEIRDAIRCGASHTDILRKTKQDHYITIEQDARAKILLGMTTLEECQKNGIL